MHGNCLESRISWSLEIFVKKSSGVVNGKHNSSVFEDKNNDSFLVKEKELIISAATTTFSKSIAWWTENMENSKLDDELHEDVYNILRGKF